MNGCLNGIEGAAGATVLSKLLFSPRSCPPSSCCSTLYPKSTAAPRSRPCTAPPTPRTSTRARWPPPGCPCSELCPELCPELLLPCSPGCSSTRNAQLCFPHLPRCPGSSRRILRLPLVQRSCYGIVQFSACRDTAPPHCLCYHLFFWER